MSIKYKCSASILFDEEKKTRCIPGRNNIIKYAFNLEFPTDFAKRIFGRIFLTLWRVIRNSWIRFSKPSVERFHSVCNGYRHSLLIWRFVLGEHFSPKEENKEKRWNFSCIFSDYFYCWENWRQVEGMKIRPYRKYIDPWHVL